MIINLTQHTATAEQMKSGVTDLTGDAAAIVRHLLTFDDIPTGADMDYRATKIAVIAGERLAAEDRDTDDTERLAMIGGAPFFMTSLERALRWADIRPVYAFSVRDSVEQPDGNGGVRKINTFRHAGFVTP